MMTISSGELFEGFYLWEDNTVQLLKVKCAILLLEFRRGAHLPS